MAVKRRDIQFFVYDAQIEDEMRADIVMSDEKNRTRYLNTLLERIYSFPHRDLIGVSSYLGAIKEIIDIWQQLPLNEVRNLSARQNRTFAQMFKHLMEVGISQYSDPKDHTS